MKITVISPFSFGYIDAIVDEISSQKGVEVTFIKTDEIKFRYKSPLQRIGNTFLKVISIRNLKKEYQTKTILKVLQELPVQDKILVIRPDKLEENLLQQLKSSPSKLICYFFDSVHNFPGKHNTIKYFDEIYSYDPDDAASLNLKFITNFIPDDTSSQEEAKMGVFSISSYDERFPLLKKIAVELEEMNVPYKFIVRKEKPIQCKGIEVIADYIPLHQAQVYIKSANILLDIQKTNQKGLSFRVFEALGYDKKLITTNEDIKNYDFFRQENILILDKDNPVIPKEFITTPGTVVPEEIKKKYRRKAWIQKVLLD